MFQDTDSDEYDEDWTDETIDVVLPREKPRADGSPDTSALQDSDLKLELMQQIGFNGPAKRNGHNMSISRLIQQREIGCMTKRRQGFSASDCRAIGCEYLPKNACRRLKFPNKVFCGTYSQDGNTFLSACKDHRIRIYDTTFGRFSQIRCIRALDVGWSILDLALSPDGNFLVYSSWSDFLHLCNVYGDEKVHVPLCLAPDTSHNFCIFSVVFSQDNTELLGGANDGCLYVYDRHRNERTLRVDAHEDDVNAVAFADDTSHILYSGSDDGLCKIWDRRTLRERSPNPVAVMAGHLDGITFIDSKGDNRYFISNSKDQTVKLWDIRRPSSPQVQLAARCAVSRQNWDYRCQQVPRKVSKAHLKLPGDSSLMTYRGHCVLNTLLRSRFSPLFNTGQRFIYVGCATGAVIVYDVLTGNIEVKLSSHTACVRDVSWHPFENMLVSSSWDCSVIQWSNTPSGTSSGTSCKARSE
jgi:WD repeat-containing protein 23